MPSCVFRKCTNYDSKVNKVQGISYHITRDDKSKQFTQMIWADTSLVGCGRARFYVSHKNTMADRLVCNFAPLGNRHGKPVYAIGYPATQCPDHTVPDDKFKALCRYIEKTTQRSKSFKDRKNTSPSTRVSSLLRILNLSNSSSKQALDPIRPLKPNVNMTEQKYQKYRHIENNTYGGMNAEMKQYNIDPMPMTSLNYNHKMMPVTYMPERRTDRHQEKGHSRVNHGHHLHTIEEIKSQETTWKDFRRFNYMTDALNVDNKHDFRKCNRNHQCTRRVATTPCYTERFYPKVQCTRKSHDDCPPTQVNQCQENILPKEICPCNIPKSSCTTPFPIPTKCMCNVNCQCLNMNNHKNRCPGNLRMQEAFTDDTRKSAPNFDYYDQLPNIGIRSGEKNRNKAFTVKNNWQFKTDVLTEMPLSTKKYIHFENINNFKESYEDNLDDTYKKLEFYQRHRRDLNDESSYKPFWKMDELTQKISPELKSLRYTTLSNRRHKGYRKTPMTTEPITINLSENNQVNRKLVTEKYLSFDELMHLRKLGETDIDLYGARRQTPKKVAAAATTKKAAVTTKAAATTKKAAVTTKVAATTKKAAVTTKAAATTKKAAVTTKAATTTTIKTSEITANTPFERKKHCTRKLTCTWTVVTVTGADGSVIGGWEVEKGSLTPEGYVDGCTRTSTCTRVYMNRNKFSTIGDGSDSDDGNLGQGDENSGDGSSIHGDEDYCEKRALDIRRRESGVEQTTPDIISQISSSPSIYDSYDSSTDKMNYEHSHESSDCTCDENLRVKRAENQHHIKETVSYGDLYYRVLKKIVNGWRKFHPSDKSKCACNTGIRITAKSYIFFIFHYLVI